MESSSGQHPWDRTETDLLQVLLGNSPTASPGWGTQKLRLLPADDKEQIFYNQSYSLQSLVLSAVFRAAACALLEDLVSSRLYTGDRG